MDVVQVSALSSHLISPPPPLERWMLGQQPSAEFRRLAANSSDVWFGAVGASPLSLSRLASWDPTNDSIPLLANVNSYLASSLEQTNHISTADSDLKRVTVALKSGRFLILSPPLSNRNCIPKLNRYISSERVSCSVLEIELSFKRPFHPRPLFFTA